MKINEDVAAAIERIILDFISRSPDNCLRGPFEEKAWESALVGFSRGNDPLYLDFKEKYIGRFHWTPVEAYNLAFPEKPAIPKELSVVTWILPQTEATKRDNRKETTFPAERWVRSRMFGEAFNDRLRSHVVESLGEMNVPAAAPVLLPQWSRESGQYGFSSTWSERHAAYAAGLGTFGLSDGLITPFGKAVRIGSVVARMEIPSTPRPYSNHHAYCLFYAKGSCKKCIERCPVGAISASGHDKIKCDAHLRPTTAEFVKAHYQINGFGCGLCQTGVPCESRIPLNHEA